jgi:hypothetical protein
MAVVGTAVVATAVGSMVGSGVRVGLTVCVGVWTVAGTSVGGKDSAAGRPAVNVSVGVGGGAAAAASRAVLTQELAPTMYVAVAATKRIAPSRNAAARGLLRPSYHPQPWCTRPGNAKAGRSPFR